MAAGLGRAKAPTVWLTGLPGAGKSTLAQALAGRFAYDGIPHLVLDGDVVRAGLCRDLGFSTADRQENIRRVAEVAALLNRGGVTAICALISPLSGGRRMAREIVGDGQFIEVHVSTPLEVCELRDPKGLYQRARAGTLPEFTGVSSPYQPPVAAELVIDSSSTGLTESIALLHDAWVERARIRIG